MKRFSVLFSLFLLILCCTLPASTQTAWVSLDGPWYASIARDVSIGYANGIRVIYVADSTGSSLLKTTDDGDTWRHLDIQIPLCVACDPNNADIVFVGTYDQEVKKSTDQGDTWTTVYTNSVNWPYRLRVSPHDPQTVYLGWILGENQPSLLISPDGGQTWNAGGNFPSITRTDDILWDPTNSSTVYVAAGDGSGSNAGVWRSVNGGNSWSPIRDGLLDPRIGSIAINPEDPLVLYAGNNAIEAITQPRVYKSTNRGDNWFAANPSAATGFVMGVQNDPRTPNVVYSAFYLDPPGGGIYKSEDGGSTWQAVTPRRADDFGLSAHPVY